MDLTASGVRTTPVAKQARTGLLPANVVLGGSLLSLVGLTWDIQWHSDVGPDTFFTLPHLFLYAGSAVVGLASLAVVLLTTAARRAGRPVDPRVGGRVVNVFGRTFAAPLGYLVSGVGAATFLLYGLWDQWWHGLYGFDAVIDSPPHIGLLLSITVSLIGTTAVFAAAREHLWGRIGTLASLTVLLTFGPVLSLGLQQVPDDYADAVSIGCSMMAVLLVAVGASFLGRPGGAVGTAALVAVVQGVFWWFSPWAAKAYADLVDLPLRDAISGVPEMPSLTPLALLPVAALMELGYLAGRRRGWRASRVSAVVGGIAGALLGLSLPVQRTLLYTGAHLPPSWWLATTAVVSGLFGLLGGFAGWRFGGMLRLLAPAKKGETADA